MSDRHELRNTSPRLPFQQFNGARPAGRWLPNAVARAGNFPAGSLAACSSLIRRDVFDFRLRRRASRLRPNCCPILVCVRRTHDSLSSRRSPDSRSQAIRQNRRPAPGRAKLRGVETDLILAVMYTIRNGKIAWGRKYWTREALEAARLRVAKTVALDEKRPFAWKAAHLARYCVGDDRGERRGGEAGYFCDQRARRQRKAQAARLLHEPRDALQAAGQSE